MHGGVSKVGKEIDRNFTSDLIGVARNDKSFECDATLSPIINSLISDHLLSVGRLDIAETLAKESNMSSRNDNRATFEQIKQIMDALKLRDLEPALRWSYEHRCELEQRASKLHFVLHRQKFIELLRSHSRHDALVYCRNLQQFADKHCTEIQKLMGCLAYATPSSSIDQSPYAHLFADVQWHELEHMFARDACAMFGLSTESALSVILNAGTVALPTLLSLRRIMQQRQVASIWTASSDELPVEIDLGPERHYHSVFSCPILRQQTTENNPPMRLTCGHVISRDALHKLAQNNRYSRLKCPYCPTESTVADAKRVYF